MYTYSLRNEIYSSPNSLFLLFSQVQAVLLLLGGREMNPGAATVPSSTQQNNRVFS